MQLTINYNKTCAWCGKTINNNKEFCSGTCQRECEEAYHRDMASIAPPVPLWAIYEDKAAEVCPVCEERPIAEGKRTCLNANCQDCWKMAWDTK
jgi:predicted nucleic acid-binding Zn ribbon protein